MDSRKRNRRPVVCNVCRRRKIRCDRGKPACSACKKSNVTHLCVYEEPGEGSRARGAARGLSLDEYDTPTKRERERDRDKSSLLHSGSSKGIAASAMRSDQQILLQQQQSQFHQQLVAQQLQHQSLQSQMAAKYGVSGATEVVNGRNGILMLPGVTERGIPPTYNVSHNLQLEWEFLKNRLVQVERDLGIEQQQQQEVLLPQIQQKPEVSEAPVKETTSEDIDPSLFEPDELMTIYQYTIPLAKYLDVESSGLYGNNTFIKKDIIQVLMHLNLKNYSKTLDKKIQRGDKFDIYLHNQQYQIEEAFKHSPTSINDLVKRITKILPTKKIVWLMIDKFFTNIDALISILDEKEFSQDISKIIGPREMSDLKIIPKINIDDNYQIVDLAYLTIIIRIVQISLLTTTKLDKQNNFLLKNSQISNEYDSIIEILLVLVKNFNINQLTQLRLNLFTSFLELNNFYGNVNGSTDNANLAISLNLNNKNEIGTDPVLSNIWYNTYFNYYNINQRKGIPLLLNEDFFNLDCIFKPELGEIFNQNLREDFIKQVEINSTIKKVLDKFNDYSENGIPFVAIDKLLKEYDDVMHKNNGDFQVFKKAIASGYTEKLNKTNNHINHILLKLNILALCLTHYETYIPKNKTRVIGYFAQYMSILKVGILDSFDILKNYTNYYYSGYEFVLFPIIIHFFERIMKYMQNHYIRTRFLNCDSLATLKLLITCIEELENYPILNNYFNYWKLNKRTKIILQMSKNHYLKNDKAIDLFNLKPKVNDDLTLDFTKLLDSNFNSLTPEQYNSLETPVNDLNNRFDTKYNKITNVADFFNSFDFDEQFDLDLFY